MPLCPLPPSPRRRPNALWLRATFSSRFSLQCMTVRSRRKGVVGGKLTRMFARGHFSAELIQLSWTWIENWQQTDVSIRLSLMKEADRRLKSPERQTMIVFLTHLVHLPTEIQKPILFFLSMQEFTTVSAQVIQHTTARQKARSGKSTVPELHNSSVQSLPPRTWWRMWEESAKFCQGGRGGAIPPPFSIRGLHKHSDEVNCSALW